MRHRVPSTARPSHSAAAFTLVELLVVIGIIALLISVLLPTLGKARQSANSLKCKSNMRQIGQAFTIYTQSSRGRLPPSRMGSQSYSAGGYSVENKSIYWFERLMGEHLLPTPAINQATDGVLICPSQAEPQTVTWLANSQGAAADDPRLNRFRLSYGLNNWLSIDDWKGGPGGLGPDGIDDSILNKKSLYGGDEYPKCWGIHYSSEKVVLADNQLGFQLYHWQPNTPKVPANLSDEIDWRRHGGKAKFGKANFLFADGHVAEVNQGEDKPGHFNELNGMLSTWGPDVNAKAKRQWTPITP